MKARGSSGLTVVEVLIALVVLAVGVMGAAQLQATSLRFTSQADLLKTSTQVAEAEVEWRRQTDLTMGLGMGCESHVPDGYGCEVDIVPCNAVGASLSFTCAPGLVNPVAYRISVTVDGARLDPFTLSTITTGTYVTGVVGTGEVAPWPTDPTDPTDPPTDPGDPEPSDPRPCIKWHPNKGTCQKYGD